MDTVCSDCNKVLAFYKIIAICDICHSTFCEKHSKQGPRNSKICRSCFIYVTKKKVLREFTENPQALQKELQALKNSKCSSKKRLEKKVISLKSLKSQLIVMRTYHKDLMHNMKKKMKLVNSSYKSLEQANINLQKAKCDLNDCLVLKRNDLVGISDQLSRLMTEKSNMIDDISKIRKLSEALLFSLKSSVPYRQLKVFCCVKCIKKVKQEFRKHANASTLSSSSLSDNSSMHSLPAYPSESCKCLVF